MRQPPFSLSFRGIYAGMGAMGMHAIVQAAGIGAIMVVPY